MGVAAADRGQPPGARVDLAQARFLTVAPDDAAADLHRLEGLQRRAGGPFGHQPSERALPDAGDKRAEGMRQGDDPTGVADAGNRLREGPKAREGRGWERRVKE